MKRVIISGGGTGGHIFPAIAIAHALKALIPSLEILFIGARGRMEMEKVPAAGYPIEGLTISGFQRRLTWKNLMFPFRLAASLLQARRIIRRFGPDVVIGVGGYASGPTLRVATSMGIPTLIQEQNSFPGVTNRILASKVGTICVAYEGLEKFFPAEKIVFTGNPIRRDLVDLSGKRAEGIAHYRLDPHKKTLLVIGGSLGAGTINQAMLQYLTTGEVPDSLQVIWQTGKYYYESVQSEVRNPGIRNLTLLSFIDRMDLAYAVADIIVSRAGAIAISELCMVGKPVILIPSPNVAEDHQTKNAMALVAREAAVLLADRDAVARLGSEIGNLLSDENRCTTLSAAIRKLGTGNAAEKIAREAFLLAGIPKSLYFVGAGGIGMSALARYYREQGATVSGYDKTVTPLTQQLGSEGILIHYTDNPSQIPASVGMAIYTPAIPGDLNELATLRGMGIPIFKRAEALGMISSRYKTIAVAGTHGKTTVSTLIAHILRTAGLPHTAFLGGISKNYGTNYLSNQTHAGRFEGWCVAEADEYDRSFLQLSPTIAIITSADPDHLDIYGDHSAMKQSFTDFTARIREGGTLLLKEGAGVTPSVRSRVSVIGYHATSASGYRATNLRIEKSLFHFDLETPQGPVQNLVMGVPGRFNLENAIAASAAALTAGVDHQSLRSALASYSGVVRRFDVRILRDDFAYIDDYAHHPEELKACITAVREIFPGKRITGMFQPHLFTRTRDLADEFARSLELLDELILLDIYPAREKPIEGITSRILLDRVNLATKVLLPWDDVLNTLENSRPEVLLTLGAGDIDRFTDPITELFTNTGKA